MQQSNPEGICMRRFPLALSPAVFGLAVFATALRLGLALTPELGPGLGLDRLLHVLHGLVLRVRVTV